MRSHGWGVLELSRIDRGKQQGEFLPYSLEHGISSDMLRDVDVLIHCAYDFQPVAPRDIWRINVEGSARLFAAARQAEVKRIVCISSISAYSGCRSLYGKAKLAIEDHALKAGGIVVRPGLVYGKEAGGMLGSLSRMMASAKVVPLIGGGSWMMYLAFEEDLCDLICQLSNLDIDANHKKWVITAASSLGKPFRELLYDLGRAHANNPVFLRVPWRIVWTGLRFLETVGVQLGFRSDSVLSLVYPNPRPSFTHLQEVGMIFRDFSPALLK
jgi:nucleoside-diphosphate-sugar epimerase